MKETPFGNVLGVISARTDSKTIEKKPLKMVGGKPLIVIAFETAQKAKHLSQIFIATDTMELQVAGKEFGADVLVIRDEIRSGLDRAAAVWRTLGVDEWKYVVSMPCDLPFVPASVIDRCVEVLAESSEEIRAASVAIPIYDEQEFLDPRVVKTLVSTLGELVWFSRAPSPYVAGGKLPDFVDAKGVSRPLYGFRHVPIYAFKPDALFDFGDTETSPLERLENLEQLRLIEMNSRIAAVIIDRTVIENYVDVDNDDDLKRAVEIEAKRGMI